MALIIEVNFKVTTHILRVHNNSYNNIKIFIKL